MKKLFLQIILPIIAIVGILGFITLLSPIKQQHAAHLDPQHYADCGGDTIQISVTDSPDCASGTANGIGSYQSTAHFTILNGNRPVKIAYNWAQYWCSVESSGPCIGAQNQVPGVQSTTNTLSAGGSIDVPTNTSSPRSPFAACGYYQNDIAWQAIDANTGALLCTHGNMSDPATSNSNASWCHTGTTCVAPTNTPVPPTNTPVPPTNTPVPTVGPTNTPVPTDCDGDTDAGDPSEAQECATPTNTPVPPTNTPVPSNNGCAGTQTGTNNNSNCNSNTQTQTQTQNNNQTVNITLGNEHQQQQQQQVLAAATVPTQLPSTGSEGQILLGLLTLIPVGWKIRKLI